MTHSDLPGLSPARATALADSWNDGGLWEDVMSLSRRCWEDCSSGDAALRWHHLVLAVGNFKRQAGRMSPPRISGLSESPGVSRETFRIPSGLVLHRDEEDSWRELEAGFHGVGLATATTLLAALWPEHHFIFDRRVHEAADGIRIEGGLAPTPATERYRSIRKRQRVGFADYAMVRGWLRTIDCPLRTSERALYRLSQLVPNVAGRSWEDYGKAVAQKLGDF
jgi:hypothetical protein